MNLTSLCRTLLVSVLGLAIWMPAKAQKLVPLTFQSSPAAPSAIESEQSVPMTLPADSAAPSAVEDITNHPWDWQDLFEAGSPIHLGLTLAETYDDNIFISSQKAGDLVSAISPNFDFEEGDRTSPHMNYFNVHLSSDIYFYDRHSEQNRQDYDADLFYQYQWTRLTLGITQQYQHLTDTSIDIGDFAVRDIYTTSVNGSYVYNDNLTLEGDAVMRITDYSTQSDVDTNEYIAEAYALYQVAPKLSLGLGPRVGYTDIIGAPNENFEDLLFHLSYNPGGKLTGTFSGGAEYFQDQGQSGGHLLPVFELTASYVMSDETVFTLSASRQNSPSYDIVGQNMVTTTVQGGVRQQFLRDLYFTASAGYSLSNYEFGSALVAGPERTDNYYFASAGLEWDPRKWLKVSARYSRSEDDSNFQSNSFEDDQIGVETSAQF